MKSLLALKSFFANLLIFLTLLAAFERLSLKALEANLGLLTLACPRCRPTCASFSVTPRLLKNLISFLAKTVLEEVTTLFKEITNP